MKKPILDNRLSRLVVLAIALISLYSCIDNHPAELDSRIQAAKGVIHRRIPQIENRLILEIKTFDGANDAFELSVNDGMLVVKGNSSIALCRGVYDYLKNDLKCLVSWDGDRIDIPDLLPEIEPRTVRSPVKYRHYLNHCTAGYSMAFWDWERWERQIDWMALHGINMPLSMNGQEKVWQTVWSKLGVPDEEIRAFFSGPAFLPFLRMGVLDSWQGPLPQRYIDGDAMLQSKILDRERELGMMPILPAFSGFVPDKMKELYPAANISNSAGWHGFEPTNLLEPRDSLFYLISKMFGEEYEKEYGERSGYYIPDLYTEMSPQVKEETKLEELAEISSNVFASLKTSDPNAIWVMQSWMFHFEFENFWNESTVNAYLSGVPEGRLISLDLSAEREELWKTYDAIGSRPFIWNHLHNFGQRTNLYGQMDLIASLPAKSLAEADKSNLVGMGITMEGINQNYIEYELMLDMMWRDSPINLESWIANYAEARYGSNSEMNLGLWKSIFEKYYTDEDPDEGVFSYTVYQMRPSLKAIEKLKDMQPDSEKRKIIEAMLQMPKEIQNSPLFIRDLVDVSKGYFQEHLADLIVNIELAIRSKNMNQATELRMQFDSLLDEIDALLATISIHRMDNWIGMARDRVETEGDMNLMEKNARIQVTRWGGSPELNDYARKEWSGLVSGYYKLRWNLFFDEYSREEFDKKSFEILLNDWEYAWSEKRDLPEPKKVTAIGQVKMLMELTE